MSWTGAGNGSGAGGINVGVIKLVMYDTVLRLIWGGAPMRFPKPKWSMVEGGIGWIAPLFANVLLDLQSYSC